MLNLEMNNPTFDNVKKQARHHWAELLIAAGIDAKALRNVHGPCPGCGGKDRFRFDNHDGNGTFICSQGNGDNLSGDGFELLQHVGVASSPIDALRFVSNALDNKQIDAYPFHTEYIYRRPDRSINLKVVRTDTANGKKSFKQLLPSGKPPKTEPNFRPFPYRIDEWPLDCPILICEGEKCADALWQAGFPATTRAGGSSNWEVELGQYFTNREVIILPDNDDAGRLFARKVGDSLLNISPSVKVCELPNLPNKGDVVDWFAAGGTTDTLDEVLSQAINFQNWSKTSHSSLVLRSIGALKAKKIVVREHLHELLPPGFTLLSGAPKVGKSKLAEYISRQVAKTYPVMFLALEYNELVAQLRFGHMDDHLKLTLLLEGEVPRWDSGGEEFVEAALKQIQPSLTVIDVIGRLKKPGEARGYEGETESLSLIKQMMSKYGSDCLAVHHLRKAGLTDSADDPFERILGSTAFAAVPDNLQILLPTDDGVALHTKGRVIFPSKRSLKLIGHDFEEVNPALTDLPRNATAQKEIVFLLASDGELSVSEIATKLNKHQSQITTACQKLTDSGKTTRLPNGNYTLADTDLF